MALSDAAIKALKPTLDKAYKLTDGNGLYLLIKPNGGKYWRYDYRYSGKRKTLAIGVFPDVSLKQARLKLISAKKQLNDGIDPNDFKRELQIDRLVTFELVAREWGVKKCVGWDSPRSMPRKRLEHYVYPILGHKPIREITPVQLLQCIQKLEERGVLATAKRTLRVCGQIFRYAVATGRADRDPTQDLKGALAMHKAKSFAAITDPKQFGILLNAIDGYSGTFIVKTALQIMPMVFVRNSELRTAEWKDIDLHASEWRYFVTKTEQQHIVPLSTQTVALLTDLKCLTGKERYVFPSAKALRGEKPMSIMALSIALRILGYTKEQMTVHGFRASARTILDEVLGFRPDFIEHQLAHSVRDANGRAYNRTSHLVDRHKMMQGWSDYLGDLKNSA